MSMRTASAGILCSLLAGAALGCSSQSAPSIAAPTPAVGVATAAVSSSRFGDRETGVIFVTSQRLYYDTFVVQDPLPMEGRFQLIENMTTEFGPGQPGYLGGRWWEDSNNNGVQDPSDHFFLCPLLPPGRPTP